MTLSFRILEHISEIPQVAWDGLLEGDSDATPFVRWSFLEAFEHAGCASPESGWWPRHLTLWRDGTLIAAAPAYIRSDSDGDFSRDWGWAAALGRARIPYYPKLILSVPFTPVTGRRLLVAPGEPRPPAVAALLEGAKALAQAERLSSIHVLFPLAPELAEIEGAGFMPRMDVQCHFVNRGYADTAAWLASLGAKRRHQAKRERAAPAGQGITIHTVRGPELAAASASWAEAVFRLYRSTIEKLPWGRPWLNRAFFARVFERMPEYLEVVAAHRGTELVAGAWNVASQTRLYGRYWGCHEELPFLHFNVCLYHSIEDCIARGLAVFEGGAGGEHKLARGFELMPTQSAHAFLDLRVHESMRGFLRQERAHRKMELEHWRARKLGKTQTATGKLEPEASESMETSKTPGPGQGQGTTDENGT